MQKRNHKSKNPKKELSYLQSVRVEASKIAWPAKEKVKKDTIVVFLTCIFFSLMYWGVNTGVLAALKMILGKTI